MSYNLRLLHACGSEQVYLCVIISSASVVVGLSHYRHGGVSVRSPNSVASPEDTRVSSPKLPENPLLMPAKKAPISPLLQRMMRLLGLTHYSV